jgi:hypothetical protein
VFWIAELEAIVKHGNRSVRVGGFDQARGLDLASADRLDVDAVVG